MDLYEFIWIHIDCTRFNMFIFFSDVFMGLVCPISVPQGFAFPGKKTFLDFWIMSMLEIVRIVRIPVYTDFGTC